MDKDKLLMRLACVMATLVETAGVGEQVPASTIYLALGCDLGAYDRLVSVGTQMGWLKATSTTLALTFDGQRQAEKFSAVLAK
jgi:hypothetical protein